MGLDWRALVQAESGEQRCEEQLGRDARAGGNSKNRALVTVCSLASVTVGICAWHAFKGEPARASGKLTGIDGDTGGVSLFYDLRTIEDGYQSCFQNKTYYLEMNGKHSMMFGQRSQELSPYACQFRCTVTPNCAQFSFWSDGGCLLTSYRAYPQPYMGFEMGVISGPRSCSNMLLQAEAPTSAGQDLLAPLGVPPFEPKHATGCGGLLTGVGAYALSWKAQGRTFFDDFQFLTKSETHGAEWYLNKTEAFHEGVVSASNDGAIIRVGNQKQVFKRTSAMLHSNQAWRPDTGFMVVMKYRHVPFGPGIWPAFWLLNSDYKWPEGGELDILEYANEEASKVTFHSDKQCLLNEASFQKCEQPGMEKDTVMNCYTNYQENKLGCKPPQIRRNGKWFADNPGAIATLWDASGVYVYHIPDGEIPVDLVSERPSPSNWARWLLVYLPFATNSSCFDVARPQEIVLNIALCGDWAGNAWSNCDSCKKTGFVAPYCIPNHVTEPATDCCTIYMSHPTSEHSIKSTAFFDIEYIKVFEPSGVKPSQYAAGTFRNGGEPLAEPCVPCGTSRTLGREPGGGDICCLGCGSGLFTLQDNGTLTCPVMPG